jgi:uncharacterized protein YdhG (YjbR/CyaY superfamily)
LYIVAFPRGNTFFYSIVVKLYFIIKDNKTTFNPEPLLKTIKQFIKELLKCKRGYLYKTITFIVDFKAFL